MAGMTRAEDLPLTRRVAAFVFLMVAEFFYAWAWNTVDVLRPQFRAELGLTLTQAGSAYSAQSAGALLGAVVMGQVADRFGRRNALVAIMVGYGVFGGLGALVSSYGQLLGQRFALGFALGGIFPVLISIYMGLFPATIRGRLASIGNATFNLAVIALGSAMALPAVAADWHLVQWAGAIPPILLAPLALLIVPDDRRVRAWGADASQPPAPRLPIAELFAPGLRRVTLLLALLVGFNFFAYQAFAGWLTTFLADVRGFDPGTAGFVVAWQFAGSLIGGFFWGWFSDRFGRRLTGIGFGFGVVVILVYLFVLTDPGALRVAGFLFGFAIAASVAWAPWMSELFPVHLRSTALSIFNWGRVISFFAPLATGAVADGFGIVTAMSLSAVGFAAALVLWLMLPETLARAKR